MPHATTPSAEPPARTARVRYAPFRGASRAHTAVRALGTALLVGFAGAPAAAQLPSSQLAVETPAGWTTWWRSDRAPRRWTGPAAALTSAVAWKAGAAGVEWATLRLAGSGEAWRTDVVLVRLDPTILRLELRSAYGFDGLEAAWGVDRAPREAVLALNAGQFGSIAPWGWVVRDGRQESPPGRGPLSMALVVDTAGRTRLLAADSIGAVPPSSVAAAFQSYPLLLSGDGDVPAPLSSAGLGIDVAHRDARLALGELRDGRLLVALTRFGALGGALGRLPFGLTTPEMAALMGALGCRRAMLLDGGISGQLMFLDGDGERRTWAALRRVPLGLIALPREMEGVARR